MRQCTDCKVIKPLADFTPIRGTRWTHTRCKPRRARRGAGAPIVLVHGFASSFEANWGHSGWIDFLVGQERMVVGVDVRGHGESGKPREPGAYDLQLMAVDVLAVMDAAGVEQINLMGYSMGGRIALDLLVHAPERFNSVIIGGMGVLANPISPEDNAAIVAALATDDVSNITYPRALAMRQFAESRGHDPNSLATPPPFTITIVLAELRQTVVTKSSQSVCKTLPPPTPMSRNAPEPGTLR